MKYLPIPVGAGDAPIHRLCREPDWEPHEATWLAAWASYRAENGNPWRVKRAVFEPDMAEQMLALWKTRRGGGPIARIRKTDRRSCPICGSQSARSVDHFLPRVRFPEFGIMLENLVPACATCNSGVKGDSYRGAEAPARFIHPYYDDWANQPLWRVELIGEFEAAEFSPVAESHLDEDIRPIVQFHLDNVLGEEWQSFNARYWGTLPLLIHNRLQPGPLGENEALAELCARLRDEGDLNGENCWQAAFLRGVLGTLGAAAFLATRAQVIAAMA